jgi:hypothetical protein
MTVSAQATKPKLPALTFTDATGPRDRRSDDRSGDGLIHEALSTPLSDSLFQRDLGVPRGSPAGGVPRRPQIQKITVASRGPAISLVWARRRNS